jgi:L-ascorbate metabolism protein UlaG (beta-lactamase superfamily)
MCIADALLAATQTRMSRRQMLGAGAAGLSAAALASSPALAQPSYLAAGELGGAARLSQAGGPGSAGVNLRSFGTNAWEITSGNKTLWIDPWLTRYDTGAFSGHFDGSTPITVDTSALDKYITNVDMILLGHGHFDHIADVPYLAKKTGAMVIGSETHNNMLRAFGVPHKQLVQVSGGENMQFDGFSIEVFRSLHGLDGNKQFVFPHSLNTVPGMPTRTDQLYEGGTFIYQLTRDDGFAILLMSTGNFVERELSGLHPDVAILGATSTYTQTHQYNARLLKALNYPAVILPTHWDNWEKPLTEPAVGNVDPWVAEVKQLSPNSQVVVLDHLQSYAA